MAKGYNSQSPPGDIDQSKMKSEEYRLLGGINSKVNLYSNGQAEFRDLSNLNFINTGALTKRPGTTLYAGSTLANFTGTTFYIGDITSGYEYAKLNGSSYVIICANGFGVPLGGQNALLQASQDGFTSAYGFSSLAPLFADPKDSIFSFVTFVDRLFAANGRNFYRMDPLPNVINGTLNGYKYSLPAASVFTNGWTCFGVGASPYLGFTLTGAIVGISTAISASGLSGTFVFGYSFINDRGFIGPPSNGITLSLNGTTYSLVQCQVSGLNELSLLYGATAIQLYISEIDGVVLTAYSQTPIIKGGGDTQTLVFSTSNGLPYPQLLDTAPVASQDFDLTNSWAGSNAGSGINHPRYLEIFNNQLFMGGFSTMPSTFWWSEIGEPEGIQPDFSAEVRSNDGDRLTGFKSYLGSLVITKQRSFHLLSGTDPSNFTLQELSDQYGCLSHRALVVWNNNLWFLDSKGIMEYNGANIRCVSTKIEPVFNAMNIQAAIDNACGVHVKQWNELWFAIPANGATINNMIVVYDYVADSWTHYDGIQAQCLFMAYAGFSSRRPFYGGYTGGLMYFDPTLTSDNDQGITCHFDSIFFSARGQSIQNQYRRFYLDVNPVLGFTQPINMTFKQDFGTTVQVARTMYQNPFQSRIDFGISSRSIQASMYHYSASLPLVINGFTFESRMQRMV